MLFSANELYYAILCYSVHLHICCVALLSMLYAHSCNIHSSEAEYFSEGDDLED